MCTVLDTQLSDITSTHRRYIKTNYKNILKLYFCFNLIPIDLLPKSFVDKIINPTLIILWFRGKILFHIYTLELAQMIQFTSYL